MPLMLDLITSHTCCWNQIRGYLWLPMVLVAVTTRLSLGQSKKLRLALEPFGTTIFSCTTALIAISQKSSTIFCSIWRLSPSSFWRSTVHKSEQGKTTRTMSATRRHHAQGEKKHLNSHLMHSNVFKKYLTWKSTPKPRDPKVKQGLLDTGTSSTLHITVCQQQAEVLLIISWLDIRQCFFNRSHVVLLVRHSDFFALAFWLVVVQEMNREVMFGWNNKVPLHWIIRRDANGTEEVRVRLATRQDGIHG